MIKLVCYFILFNYSSFNLKKQLIECIQINRNQADLIILFLFLVFIIIFLPH